MVVEVDPDPGVGVPGQIRDEGAGGLVVLRDDRPDEQPVTAAPGRTVAGERAVPLGDPDLLGEGEQAGQQARPVRPEDLDVEGAQRGQVPPGLGGPRGAPAGTRPAVRVVAGVEAAGPGLDHADRLEAELLVQRPAGLRRAQEQGRVAGLRQDVAQETAPQPSPAVT
ncbi:hypothetical protein GCM10027612_22370 [Microbispora bryophytorum subsp. camponoti]